MSIDWDRTYTVEWPDTFEAGAGNAWNDYENAVGGFKAVALTNNAGLLAYGRGFFGSKYNIYLAFGPLGIPTDATITEVMLTITAGPTINAGGVAVDTSPNVWFGVMPRDGRWDIAPATEAGGYYDGMHTNDIALGAGIEGPGGTADNVIPPSISTQTIQTHEAGAVEYGQSVQNTHGAAAMVAAGLAMRQSEAGSPGARFYTIEVYEMPGPDADLSDCTFFGRSAAVDCDTLPAHTTSLPLPVVYQPIIGTPTMIADAWYFIGLNIDWAGTTTGRQIDLQLYGEDPPQTDAANDGGSMRGLGSDWTEASPTERLWGFMNTGYPSAGHLPELSTRLDDSPPVFSNRNFGTVIGPAVMDANPGTVNKIAEGFADQSPTDTVTGLVSNLQNWIAEPDYDQAGTGRDFALIFDESDAEDFGDPLKGRLHQIHSARSLTGGIVRPTLSVRYTTPGTAEGRYEGFGTLRTVRTNGFTAQSLVRSSRFGINE